MASTYSITNVFYQNPLTPAPQDISDNGVLVYTSPSTSQSDVLVARLMQGNTVLVSTCGGLGAQLPKLQVPSALAETSSYYVQVQAVPFAGGNYSPQEIINSVNWDSSATLSAPILPSVLNLTEGEIEINDSSSTLALTLNWNNVYPVSVYMQVFADGPPALSGTLISCTNHSQSLSFSYSNTLSPYTAIFRPLIPINTPSSWPPSEILTIGYSAGTGMTYTLPVQSPTISTVTTDGTTVTASWVALSTPDTTQISYELLLTCDGVTTAYPTSPTGGIATLPDNSSFNTIASVQESITVLLKAR